MRNKLGRFMKENIPLNKGKHMWINGNHPRGMLGKESSRKGKKYEEFYGIEKARELKQIMSNKRLGKKQSKETKKKISIANIGKKRNKESIKKMVKTMKYQYDNGLRIKGMLGKIVSKETKLKISLGLKRAYKEERKKPIRMFGKDNPFYEKTHTKETREIIRKANLGLKKSLITINKKRICKGERASNWKGGITPLNRRLRSSSLWRIWREAVFLRDNFTCQNPNCSYCNNKIGVFLHPHHLKSFSDYPELRFNIDNGITYCKEFHINSKLLHKNLLNEEILKCG